MDDRTRALVVDDEPGSLAVAVQALARVGFEVTSAVDVGDATAVLRRERPDLVVSDLHLPDGEGLELLERVHEEALDTNVVIMTGLATVRSAVEAIRRGAWDYLVKPVEVDDLVSTVLRACEHQRVLRRNKYLERRVEIGERFGGIVGRSARMRGVFEMVDRVAPVDTTVLVHGESGTGKELLVRALHERSPRAGRPLVAFNCGAFAEQLVESELFGHQRGAFTGATATRRGLFEEAHGGTLFLDEVGELSLALQVKLLRVLQEGEIRPVGSNATKKVSVRVVSATHRDLGAAVAAGRFREDLYFRLNVVRIELPPLRERPEDVPLLAHHFVQKHAARHGREPVPLTAEVLERLTAHPWPGNVRELENAIERALVLGGPGGLLLEALPAPRTVPGAAPASGPRLVATQPLAQARDAFEQTYLADLLAETQGSIGAAARLAGIDRTNFRRLLRRHGLAPRGSGDPPGSA